MSCCRHPPGCKAVLGVWGKLAGGAAPPCCTAARQPLGYQCCWCPAFPSITFCLLLLPGPSSLHPSRSGPEAKARCPKELQEPPRGTAAPGLRLAL